MTSARLAVIDLGTNTFHLLIAEASGGLWKELFRERIFVNLAEGGIDRIGNAAKERGMVALKHFRGIIDDHGISDVMAVGTAALRRAENSDQFVVEVYHELGFEIQVIDGQTEASYINAGVHYAVPDFSSDSLIMDIGGGSVEFIISSNGKPAFSVSYPIGVAVLYDKFHGKEPINIDQLNHIDQYLTTTMRDLTQKLSRFSELHLIGASGTFEVIDSALQKQRGQTPFSKIEKEDFFAMYNRVIPMTYEQRMADRNIPSTRARYIVVALKLIHHVLSVYPIVDISVSRYALKEGIVSEWLSNLD